MKKYFLLFLPLLIACSSENSSILNTSNSSSFDSSISEVNTSSSDDISTNENTSSITSSTEDNLYTINGTIYLLKDSKESPLKDITFELKKESTTYLRCTSNENGEFTFYDVEEGNYRLTIYITLDGIKDYPGEDINVSGENKEISVPKIVLEYKGGHWSELS